MDPVCDERLFEPRDRGRRGVVAIKLSFAHTEAIATKTPALRTVLQRYARLTNTQERHRCSHRAEMQLANTRPHTMLDVDKQ